ncbi:SWIM zinc finger family protein [Flexivirga oryzae]|uniref:SWIM-type domain-containing protein n=1 Tax=Flexivirga oryzae TaxID=1794944 RepID=A0A839N7A5_9MICO|nr:SWIM zinc finger family protein [Flexivirga oryzae]MBB2893640.1 hypothetical protein [Flexivirga oryzae]
MARWSLEQVRGLAPDDSSLAAARKLSSPGPWSETGSTDLLVWGNCQGSGKKPYQVSVDLSGPAFRCSCPSRKFPCKHALALLMLWAAGEDGVGAADRAADFAGEWAAGRSERAAKARTPREAPADPEARAKRVEQRIALMDAGIEQFAGWLRDLVRGGLAAAHERPYSWWDGAAARLVDAQCPRLAESVRDMASAVHRGDDWADVLLDGVGRWWLIVHTWQRRDALTPDTLADLRAALGWSYAAADLPDGDRVSGTWLVLGAHRSDDGRLRQQRTWLRETTTGELLQVLDFAAGQGVLVAPQLTGSLVTATLARYPGSAPKRARFVETADTPVQPAAALPPGSTLSAAVAAGAAAAATNPFVDLHPVVLSGAVLTAQPAPQIVDADGCRLPLTEDAEVWTALAVTGGHPVDVFGELDGPAFRPLAATTPAGVVPV